LQAPPVLFEEKEITVAVGKGKKKSKSTIKKTMPSGISSAIQLILNNKKEGGSEKNSSSSSSSSADGPDVIPTGDLKIVRLWSDCISITRRCKRHMVLKICELLVEPGSYVTGGFSRRRLVTQKTAHMYNVWSRSWDKFDVSIFLFGEGGGQTSGF
jgi:hypothetical protein